jgi:hypothetical protein
LPTTTSGFVAQGSGASFFTGAGLALLDAEDDGLELAELLEDGSSEESSDPPPPHPARSTARSGTATDTATREVLMTSP